MQTTFPRLMMQHAAQRPAAPALREKEYGIWQTWSWARAAEDVKLMSCGLAALGFEPGQNLAIVGDNRPHLYMAFIAAQSLRGVPVPMYQDAIASEMAFVLQDAEIQFAFAENQEQVDKLLELRESVPGLLKHIIYDDPRGLRNYSHEGLISIERLFEFGRQYAQQHP
ncbi:MAG TPA: long-chain fatty acid--CoA ligase, partial [Curvibacter sp.]|nr:long-chain fatty acid--CoA ligase [Curvibacter sp.]